MYITDAINHVEFESYDGIARTESYIKEHGHPPFWNPTMKDIAAADWRLCNTCDIITSKYEKNSLKLA